MRLFSTPSTDVGEVANNDGSAESRPEQSPDVITQDRAPSTSAPQDEKAVGSGLQDGVAKVEATTIIWAKRDLIMVYVL